MAEAAATSADRAAADLLRPSAFSRIFRRRRWRVLAAVAFSLALVAIIAALVLPGVIKRETEAAALSMLGRKLTIAETSFNPLTLSVTLKGASLFEPDGATRLLSIERVELSAAWSSLWQRALVVDRCTIRGLDADLLRSGPSQFNFSDIVERIRVLLASDSKPLRLSLNNIRLLESNITLVDQVGNRTHQVNDLTLGIPFISNLPSAVALDVEPLFSAHINGTPIKLTGRVKPFSDTLESIIDVDLADFDLPSYFAFLPAPLPVNVASAKLDGKLEIAFRKGSATVAQELTVRGDAAINALSVATLDARPLISVTRLAARGIDARLLSGNVVIAALELGKPALTIERERGGALAWQRVFSPARPADMARAAAGGGGGQAPAAGAGIAPAAAAPTSTSIRIGQFAVRDGSIDWVDHALAKSPHLSLNAINIDLKDFDSARPDGASALTLAAAGAGGERLEIKGSISPLARQAPLAQLEVQHAGLLPATYAPYWRPYLSATISGAKTTLAGKLVVTRDAGAVAVRVSEASLSIDAGEARLDGDPGRGLPLAKFQGFKVMQLAVDTAKRRVVVDQVELHDPQLRLQRGAGGDWNVQKLLPRSAAPGDGTTRADAKHASALPPAWQMSVARLALSGGELLLRDDAGATPVDVRMSKLSLAASNLSTVAASVAELELRATLNKSGRLSISGKARPMEPSAALKIDADNIDVAAFEPYFSRYFNARLAAGLLSAKGNARISARAGGAPALSYRGSLALAEVRALDKVSADDFVRWKRLALDGLDVSTAAGPAPAVINLGEIALNDFYARVIVNASGRLNLQDVIAKPAADAAPPSLTEAAPAGEKSPASAPVPAPAEAAARAIIRTGKITLQAGNINFTDNFVKPNYTANLTDMGGSVAAMASDNPQPADLVLRGRVDSDAPVEIIGRLNPLAADKFLDIAASAKGIELTRLTPYARKYAGYAIDKGKLSLDVRYQIRNGQLTADNRLFLDQLTFGERADSPDATKLPVLLAIALLKNGRGEIDVNLPVSGSLSDPEFSVGGVIVKLIVNLLAKAITSPFALLGAAFGGGEELAYIEFAPGAAALTPEADKKLQTLIKALNDRPGLDLDIVGRVDPAIDVDGLRKVALAGEVKAQKLKALSARGQSVDAERVSVSPAEYPQYLQAAYQAASFSKPRNLIGLAKSLPLAEMEKLMLANVSAGEPELRALADRRAEVVREALSGKVAAERVFLRTPRLTPEGIQDQGRGSRVDFVLK